MPKKDHEVTFQVEWCRDWNGCDAKKEREAIVAIPCVGVKTVHTHTTEFRYLCIRPMLGSFRPHATFVLGFVLPVDCVSFCLCRILLVGLVKKGLNSQKDLLDRDSGSPIFFLVQKRETYGARGIDVGVEERGGRTDTWEGSRGNRPWKACVAYNFRLPIACPSSQEWHIPNAWDWVSHPR